MATLIHPYHDLTGGEWLRGNLHAHTTQSDGARAPQAVIDAYARRGYGFLMLSDHDVLTSESTIAQWDSRGMVLIPGYEVSQGGPHLLHVDADRLIAPSSCRQEVLNRILAADVESGHGFAVVNHPNWESRFDHCTIEQLREWTGYLGMEIFNGVISRLDGSPYALDKWDLLLSAGRRVWGFADDDAHCDESEEGLGWNMAYVKERARAAVVEALRQGRFYCSTGVVIRSIRVTGMTVRVETENAARIAAIQNVGKRLAVVDGPVMEVRVPDGVTYVRFQCWGTGERMAWTQPFFVDRTGADEDGDLPFIHSWHVSSLIGDRGLDETSPVEAERMTTIPLKCYPAGGYIPGFVDIREQAQGQNGIIYLRTELSSESETRRLLKFGYDGPIRIWLNGQMLFDGPGANPAIADQLSLYATLRPGANQLLVALNTNQGKAWGIFGRLE
jgi:hypothetical protein